MRYIGCKINLLDKIETFIRDNIAIKQESFCDIFSGTSSVGRYFKSSYKIISNDVLYFSYVLQKAFIENDKIPAFSKLRKNIPDPINYLENEGIHYPENLFITENFSPAGKAERMYFTEKNARRIDFIRTTIENWKKENLINEIEYYYLLASLIEAVPSVSNITGTYGAYLKHWDKRAFKKLELPQLLVDDNQKLNESYNEDVFESV